MADGGKGSDVNGTAHGLRGMGFKPVHGTPLDLPPHHGVEKVHRLGEGKRM